MVTIRCQELGIHDCDYVARGESPGDAVEEMVEHLDDHHDVDLPDVEDIMDPDFNLVEFWEANLEPDDEGSRIVVQRLREHLNIPGPEGLESHYNV
jgi:predicted small metal-binding protein